MEELIFEETLLVKDSKKILFELISANPNDAYALNYLSYSMAIRNEDLIKAKKLITEEYIYKLLS